METLNVTEINFSELYKIKFSMITLHIKVISKKYYTNIK